MSCLWRNKLTLLCLMRRHRLTPEGSATLLRLASRMRIQSTVAWLTARYPEGLLSLHC